MNTSQRTTLACALFLFSGLLMNLRGGFQQQTAPPSQSVQSSGIERQVRYPVPPSNDAFPNFVLAQNGNVNNTQSVAPSVNNTEGALPAGIAATRTGENTTLNKAQGGTPPLNWEAVPVVIWRKPEVAPAWFTRGQASLGSREKMRELLEVETEVEYSDINLTLAINNLLSTDIQVFIDINHLMDNGVDEETPVSLSAKGSIRSVLERMLLPFDLAYVVHEDYITITSRGAMSALTLRAYELNAVLPHNAAVANLRSAIEATVTPEEWATSGGGLSSMEIVGSKLMVNATEQTHKEIERWFVLLDGATFVAPEEIPDQGPVGGILPSANLRATASQPNTKQPRVDDQNKPVQSPRYFIRRLYGQITDGVGQSNIWAGGGGSGGMGGGGMQ